MKKSTRKSKRKSEGAAKPRGLSAEQVAKTQRMLAGGATVMETAQAVLSPITKAFLAGPWTGQGKPLERVLHRLDLLQPSDSPAATALAIALRLLERQAESGPDAAEALRKLAKNAGELAEILLDDPRMAAVIEERSHAPAPVAPKPGSSKSSGKRKAATTK